jgi:type VI secretion system secreted protein Hcp
MAVDMFIKIDGIKGESADDKHKEEIDVLAWSWGLSQSGSAHMGGGAGAGKVNVSDLSFTKYIDVASPDLYLSCCNGKHLKDAKLVVRKAGENPLEYLIVTLEDVIVSSVSNCGSCGEDRLTESVTLNFARVKVDYTAQDAKGGSAAKPKMGWDVAANKKI